MYELTQCFRARILADQLTFYLSRFLTGCKRRIATLLRKYADLDPDLTDVALIWLAEASGFQAILTVDGNDFSTYRINGKSKFELTGWQSFGT